MEGHDSETTQESIPASAMPKKDVHDNSLAFSTQHSNDDSQTESGTRSTGSSSWCRSTIIPDSGLLGGTQPNSSFLKLFQDLKDSHQSLCRELEKRHSDERRNEDVRQAELRKLNENQDRLSREVRQLRDEVMRLGNESKDRADAAAYVQEQLLHEVQGIRESFCAQFTDDNDDATPEEASPSVTLEEDEVVPPMISTASGATMDHASPNVNSTMDNSAPNMNTNSNQNALDAGNRPAESSSTPSAPSSRGTGHRDSVTEMASAYTAGELTLGQILQDSQSEAQRRIEDLGQMTSSAWENITSATKASLGWQTIRQNHRRLLPKNGNQRHREHHRRSQDRSDARRNTVELHRKKVHLYKVVDAVMASQRDGTMQHDDAEPQREDMGYGGAVAAQDALHPSAASTSARMEPSEGIEELQSGGESANSPGVANGEDSFQLQWQAGILPSQSPSNSKRGSRGSNRGSVTFSEQVVVDGSGQEHAAPVESPSSGIHTEQKFI